MFRSVMFAAGFLTAYSVGANADTPLTVQSILGRTLESDHVKNAHIYADGTLDGVFNGITYAGHWFLNDGQYCRELTRGLVSKPACLDVAPIKDSAGHLVAVEFQAPGVRTRFDLN
ncbi:hypothetical protein O2N63_08465 [Aliiroseovarius sp. KMU-50]|uniref:Dihydrodipicolinate reductase n=1 Tax=Aliiroseovarius salicola TaxID=3009082 RepID=A0ABT4W0U9_9RHOB|nr:hypothetical protein [Aliiroseovarius sp. KMU-50]MDA5094122.1 hypothetical protein [Aliiroseovarius sp. KMU-50]